MNAWKFLGRMIAVLGILASFHLEASTTAEPFGPIRQRIDALLKRRIQPEPLPVNLPNPFQMNGSVIRTSPPDPTAATEKGVSPPAVIPAAVEDPIKVLRAVASRLKIGGVIVSADNRHIVINGVSRMAGESIPAEWNNALISVQIVRLESTQLVLRYADAEFTVRF
jgi:hypothetical protein